MTTTNLKADLAQAIALAARIAGITAHAVVKGHGRANLEVPARHAVWTILVEQGHMPTAIAKAFETSRSGVENSIKRALVPTSRAFPIIEAMRAHLTIADMPHDPATPAQAILKRQFGSPRAYAQRCVNAIGEIPAKLAVSAANNYRKRWEEAV